MASPTYSRGIVLKFLGSDRDGRVEELLRERNFSDVEKTF